jgi:osmoprotectant transport system permease protein
VRHLALGVLLAAYLPWAAVHAGEAAGARGEPRPVAIGSKAFTESVILGEVASQVLAGAGVASSHRAALGGSRVVWDALVRGEIDVYAEYGGTLVHELLAGERIDGDASLDAALARRGLRRSGYLGFANTYVLGTTAEGARRHSLARIGDLRSHPALRLGFSSEFVGRADGWPGLRDRYRLPQTSVRGLEHALAYRALLAGELDVTDFYSTDPEIARHGLVVLEDELGYFPDYRAFYLYRADLPAGAKAALESLAGRIDVATMQRMNARVTIDRVTERQVAAEFLGPQLRPGASEGAASRAELPRRLLEHLVLTGVALALAIALGIPLGIACAAWPRPGSVVLGALAVLQTVPSLALLVLMIPLLGIGFAPACAALFLYGLLPIVRGTASGLLAIPPTLRESATALGLDAATRLRRIELPLAAPTMFAGVRTAAVIAVGTATLAALIGAGGLGQPILTGIRLDDTGLILAGAIPAALLALAVDGLFAVAERLAGRHPRTVGEGAR